MSQNKKRKLIKSRVNVRFVGFKICTNEFIYGVNNAISLQNNKKVSEQYTRQCTLIALDSTNYSFIILFFFSLYFVQTRFDFFSTSSFYAYIVYSYRRRVVNKIC